jgi:peptide/nickel transport system permease protein
MATPAIENRLGTRAVAGLWRSRFRVSLGVWIPAVVVALMVAACFLGPVLFNVPDPNSGSLTDSRLPPLSPGHLLGTDALGNDILSRCLYGGRISIVVGISSVALGLVVGGAAGMLAGYKGGVIDTVITRILDMFLAFPSLVLAIAVATYLGPNTRNVIFAIAFFTVPAFARLGRASTLRLRDWDFMIASELVGQRQRRIIWGHVLPNVLLSMVTYGLLHVGVVMIIEAALDFLGVGVRPPQPTWGSMIAKGQPDLSTAPWIVFAPSVFLFVTVAFVNLLGDALRTRWETAS